MSIPKIIHYCWFGRGPKPELALKCIESWKKYCPDYEIVEWNEDNFDVMSLPFTKEAYESRKFAFVTDYVRLYAMYHHGGIYMDTDVEVRKSLDPFLKYQGFSGFEAPEKVPTGIMAGEKGFPLFAQLMEYYTDRHFLTPDGQMDMTTNVVIITEILTKLGLTLNGQFQIVDGFALFPADYFCPKDPITRELHMTENTAVIHHFDGSWMTKEQRKMFRDYRTATKLFGVSTGERILLARDLLKNEGFTALVRRVIDHFKK